MKEFLKGPNLKIKNQITKGGSKSPLYPPLDLYAKFLTKTANLSNVIKSLMQTAASND